MNMYSWMVISAKRYNNQVAGYYISQSKFLSAVVFVYVDFCAVLTFLSSYFVLTGPLFFELVCITFFWYE